MGVGPRDFCMEKPQCWKLCGSKGRDSNLKIEDCLKTKLSAERRR